MVKDKGIQVGQDGLARCWWPGVDPGYVAYHDLEWGVPVTDDARLFEKMSLEGFQAGLSWLTILRKRDRFRKVFCSFDIEKVARFTPKRVEELLQDAGIIRHRGKIEATIANAQKALELRDEKGSLAAYVWSFEPPVGERPKRVTRDALVAMPITPSSQRMSKDLRKRGFRFVGPTTMYALMQAMGLVNDHLEGCFARPLVERARAELSRPRT
jgi:DNA-3-methyladenine glycosylase I